MSLMRQATPSIHISLMSQAMPPTYNMSLMRQATPPICISLMRQVVLTLSNSTTLSEMQQRVAMSRRDWVCAYNMVSLRHTPNRWGIAPFYNQKSKTLSNAFIMQEVRATGHRPFIAFAGCFFGTGTIQDNFQVIGTVLWVSEKLK